MHVVAHAIARPTPVAALVAIAGLLALAAPARATLVYVKKPGAESPVVYVARDDGAERRRVDSGRAPAVSPDGNWIAWIARDAGLDELRLQRAGGGATLLVVRSRRIDAVRFSPDSTIVGAVLSARRLRLYTLSSDTVVPVGSGFIHGWTFSPDSKAIAWGRASDPAPEAPGDIYAAPIAPGARARRVTRTKDALNPLWGAQGIIFDRQRSRPGDAPVYNLWAIQPDGSGLRRITRLRIPSLASGLVPLDLSADGARLLAGFTAQDTLIMGFTVDPQSGATRALSKDAAQGLVGDDLSADGTTILAHTGGPNPAVAHDVVTVPYAKRAKPTVLAHRAADPHWSR
jgi:hypothetical protein